MQLKKKAEPKEGQKPVRLSRNSVETYRKFDDKSLLEVVAMEGDNLIDIKTGISSNNIPALLLEYKDHVVAFSFSNGTDETFMESESGLDGIFRIRRTQARDSEGNIKKGETPENGTGPLTISFGKAGTITYSDVKQIAGVVVPA